MQAAVGVDRQLAKRITANVTYLYGRGVHQYLTNNIGAPEFATADLNIYPREPTTDRARKQPPVPVRRRLQAKSDHCFRQG